MNIGTPPGTQLDCAVNALFFPARISSISFFMNSFAHDIRFGLVRSAMRKVGCRPTPLGTKGWSGSLTTGPGWRPGSASKYGPPPLSPTQPVSFDEKSGVAAFCCAIVDAIGVMPMRAANRLPVRPPFFLEMTQDIVVPPPLVSTSGELGASPHPNPLPRWGEGIPA